MYKKGSAERMKKAIKKMISIIICSAVVLSAAGCSSSGSASSTGSSSGSASSTGSSSEAKEESSSGAADASGDHEPVTLYLGAASSTGVSYQICVAIADQCRQKSSWLSVEPLTTTGAKENIDLMAAGENELGMATGTTAYFAATGMSEWEDAGPVEGLRSVWVFSPAYYTFITTKNSPINTFADLQGKRVSIGAVGSTNQVLTDAYFKALDIVPSEYFSVVNLDNAAGVEALQEGSVDAMVFAGGIGASSLMELAASSAGIKLVQFEQDQLQKICDMYDVLSIGTVPAGSYEGFDVDVDAVKSNVVLCSMDSVDDDVIYELCRVIDENLDSLSATVAACAYGTPEQTYADYHGTSLPLHDGTEAYLSDIGVAK